MPRPGRTKSGRMKSSNVGWSHGPGCGPGDDGAGGAAGRWERAGSRPKIIQCAVDLCSFTDKRGLPPPRRPRLHLIPWLVKHCSSAARNNSTTSGRLLCPIKPMRHALPLKSPRPPPISMPNSLSKRLRTARSSTPAGDAHGVELRQLVLLVGDVRQPQCRESRLERLVIAAMPCPARLQSFFQHQPKSFVQGVHHRNRPVWW